MKLKTGDELQNFYVDEAVSRLLPKFEALAPYKLNQRKKGINKLLEGWEALASIEARNLKINYPDEKPEAEKTYNTCLRQITALKKALKIAAKTQLKDAALYNPVCTIITHFGNALSYQFTSYKFTQNNNYRQKVNERSELENRIEIDLSNSLKFAHNVLTDIKNGKDANWLNVSCILALVTGRRMAEIHLSASFEYVDEYTVKFTGHLKGKGRTEKIGDREVLIRDIPFNIPTLINADLVVFGLQWLNDKGKRFDSNEDPERVNRRFSKTLNQHCKQFDIFPSNDCTYHKFRAAYFRACVVNANKDGFDFFKYAKSVLIDNDESTIDSYKRYELKPGSLTRI